MPGIFKHLISILFQCFHIPLTGRPVEHPCLTEAASADAAPLDFKDDAVLGHFDKWDDGRLRVIRTGEIFHHLLLNRGFCMWVHRSKGFDGSVFPVSRLIKPRHIDSFDLCRLFQKIFP